MSTNYKIVVDSTTDLPADLAEAWGLEAIPYIVTLDGKDYYNHLDYRDISSDEFYDTLRKGKMATTTQVTAHRYMEAWEPYLKEGQDILYMCLSSALSKSYDQSVMAAREAMEAYPDRKVITLDTKAASLGQGLLAYHAQKAKAEGKTLEENASLLENLVGRMQHWIVPDDLHHLRRGGRLSGASAVIGTMLSIKPILTLTDEGRIVPASKARGWAKAIDYIVARMEEYKYGDEYPEVYLPHSQAPDRVEAIKKALTEKLGIKEFLVHTIGPVIGAHTGPGTAAVIFVGSKRPEIKQK